jgi:hypothetical protein
MPCFEQAVTDVLNDRRAFVFMVKKLFQTLRHAEFTVQIRSNAIKVMTLTALLTYITGLNTGNDVLEAS